MREGAPTGGWVDDDEIVLRIMDRDDEALALMIRQHGPKVKGAMRARFRDTVPDYDLKDAFNRAVFKIWHAPDCFDPSKGSLGPWFAQIAINEVIDLLRRGRKHEHQSLDAMLEFVEIPAPIPEDVPLSPDKAKLFKDLHDVIAGLPENQRKIIMTDLQAGCSAEAAYLSETLGIGVNTVYVLRSRAHETIRTEILKRGHFKQGIRR
jgi:RNA polymerase sigma-70 factor (ECF subfamily)